MAPSVLASWLDIALDKTVLPGYSSIGPVLRRHWWPADPPAGALDGGHVVVTGASSGLGLAAATGIARYGATVHLVGRSAERLKQAAGTIRDQVAQADLVEEVCDLSDLDDVRRYASDLRGRLGALHAIVHDAGVMPPERRETDQGHELALATHVLGPLLLTEELRPTLAAAASPRVVVVSSGGMYSAPLDTSISDDLEYEQGSYKGVRAYARTKRLQVTMSEELGRRYSSDRIAVHSMHPGWAATPGITDSMPRFSKVIAPVLRSAEAGADTIVWLTSSDDAARTTGEFWSDRRRRSTYYLPGRQDDPRARRAVWEQCCGAIGVIDLGA